jgi:hypothetical protein
VLNSHLPKQQERCHGGWYSFIRKGCIVTASAEEKLNREVNSVVYPVSEFKKKEKEVHYFVKTMLEDQKIVLIDNQGTLQRLHGDST